LLPAGAVAGWALHPLESAALSRRTPISDIDCATQVCEAMSIPRGYLPERFADSQILSCTAGAVHT
jgi:hypothetical protein